MTVEVWGRERAADVTALVAAALPGEDLSIDELLAVCWDDPGPDDAGDANGIVLVATPGDEPVGVAVGVVRSLGEAPSAVRLAWVKLVAVHPDHRRQGIGHELLAAVEAWAWEQGATELHLAGSPPFYLWPGVDATATEMLCLLEARGYRDIGSDVNMALATTFRAEAPAGVTTRRVVEDTDVARVEALLEVHWPEWLDETRRAIEHGCCHGAFVEDDDGSQRAVGFVCHSVNRAAWLGPMGTDPSLQQGGVGSALVALVCRDLQIAEFDATEISWVGPARFYAKKGATISRVFRRFRLRRPDPTP